jgi:hypothetical protein
MARKTVTRTLPPLDHFFADFSGFPEDINRTEEVQKLLIQVIESSRAKSDLPFYSMREVATFFKISLKTSSNVFARLQKAGLLTLVRGASTFIPKMREQSRHEVRGVIGIPVLLPGFVIGNEFRMLYILLEEQLRLRNYVADFIFYREQDESASMLADRLLLHNLDIVFWPAPSPGMKECILRLQDAGVRVCIMGDAKIRWPDIQFYLDLESAFDTAAEAWRAEGISSVILALPKVPGSHQVIPKIAQCFERIGMEVQKRVVFPEDLSGMVRELHGKKSTGLIFAIHSHYDMLCDHDHPSMRRLFAEHRSFLAQGPICHAAFIDQAVFVDSIEFPASAMAAAIANDIASMAVWSRSSPRMLQVEWVRNIDLGKVRPFL